MNSSRYKKVRKLGSGSFGEAWLARSVQSQRSYVIKELKMAQSLTEADKGRVHNEVMIIRSCCHLNIIKYKDYFITQEAGGPIMSIVMEYADAGDLNQCIEKRRDVVKEFFPESQVRNWFVQICFALQYLHRKNIIHRDIKTQNIFMCSNKLVKLGDFGISKTLSNENDFATTGVGTPQYMSPEIYNQQPYDYKSDIWCLGCVLYEMCALRPAFAGTNVILLMSSILNCAYAPLPNVYSPSIGELVKVMLRTDPSRRPAVSQLVAATVLQTDIVNYMEYIKTLMQDTSSTTGSGSDGSHLELRHGSASSLSSSEGFQNSGTSSST